MLSSSETNAQISSRELALTLAGWIAERITEGGAGAPSHSPAYLATESGGDRRTRVFQFEADVAALLDGDTARAHRFLNAAIPAAAERAARNPRAPLG